MFLCRWLFELAEILQCAPTEAAVLQMQCLLLPAALGDLLPVCTHTVTETFFPVYVEISAVHYLHLVLRLVSYVEC